MLKKIKFLSISPTIRNFKNKFDKSKQKINSVESIFTEIYKTNKWGGVSRSGPGSDLNQTIEIRKQLPIIFNDLTISSILDIPCGDFCWMKEIKFNLIDYIGADVVDEIIHNNIEKFSTDRIKFIKLDILQDDLPTVDMIICRDLFIHFSIENINKSLNKIKRSKSKYFLATSYTTRRENRDIPTGSWRPLNLCIKPFSLPKPLKIIEENISLHGEEYSDKSLLLWKISDLPNEK